MNKSNTNNSDKRKSVYSNDITPTKTLQDLNMMDSFLFEATTEDIENAKKIAKVIIRRATGHSVENLIIEPQKQLKGLSLDKHGIRMDLYIIVVENHDLVYNDGITKIILYTKGTKGGSKELKDFLTYMENTTLSNAVDSELLELHEIISNIKSKEDVGERYMTLQEMIDYEKRDSYEDGLKNGLNNGIKASINICKSLKLDHTQTKAKLLEQFLLLEEQADEYLNLYW